MPAGGWENRSGEISSVLLGTWLQEGDRWRRFSHACARPRRPQPAGDHPFVFRRRRCHSLDLRISLTCCPAGCGASALIGHLTAEAEAPSFFRAAAPADPQNSRGLARRAHVSDLCLLVADARDDLSSQARLQAAVAVLFGARHQILSGSVEDGGNR